MVIQSAERRRQARAAGPGGRRKRQANWQSLDNAGLANTVEQPHIRPSAGGSPSRTARTASALMTGALPLSVNGDPGEERTETNFRQQLNRARSRQHSRTLSMLD